MLSLFSQDELTDIQLDTMSVVQLQLLSTVFLPIYSYQLEKPGDVMTVQEHPLDQSKVK